MLGSRLRRWFLSALLLAALALPLPAAAQSLYFWVGVRDEYGAAVTSGVTCRVLTANSVSTNATVYTDAALASAATNPLTATSAGVCAWYGADTTTSYDVIVTAAAKGARARLQAVTVTDHSAILPSTWPYKYIRFPFAQNASETDTGLDLPEGAMVQEVIVEVVTGVTSGTLTVGLLSSETGGDADGFVVALPATPAGFYGPGPTWTAGSTMKNYLSASTRGALLAAYTLGADAANDPGSFAAKPHLVLSGNATSLTYSTSAHAVAGYVHVMYLEVGNR